MVKFTTNIEDNIETQQESPNARGGKMSIDKDEHLWYNTFNKWIWNKFENGVVKIESVL